LVLVLQRDLGALADRGQSVRGKLDDADPAVDRAVVEVALAVRSRDDFRVDDIAPGGLARPRLPGLRAGDVCTGVGPGPGRGRRGRDPDGTPALVVADVDDE